MLPVAEIARRLDDRFPLLTGGPGTADARHRTLGATIYWSHDPPVGIEAKAILERMLRRGFTTVRDAGGLDVVVQEALRAGLVSGPRVFRSGRVLSQTGGHGDIAPANNDPHGLIAPGTYADVLLVDGDLLTDIGVLTGQGEHLDLIARAERSWSTGWPE